MHKEDYELIDTEVRTNPRSMRNAPLSLKVRSGTMSARFTIGLTSRATRQSEQEQNLGSTNDPRGCALFRVREVSLCDGARHCEDRGGCRKYGQLSEALGDRSGGSVWRIRFWLVYSLLGALRPQSR